MEPSKIDWEHLCENCPQSTAISEFYHRLDNQGLNYGKEFQSVRKIQTGDSEVIVELEGESSSALMDGILQAIIFFADKNSEKKESTYLPYSIDTIDYFAELGKKVRSYGKITQLTEGSLTADIEIFSYDGTILVKIHGFHARKTDQHVLQQLLTKQTEHTAADWCYQICWQTKPLVKSEALLREPWLIVSENEEKIEGLEAKTIIPAKASAEVVAKSPAGIVWFLSGKDSLQQVLNFITVLDKQPDKPILYFVTRGIQPIGAITDLEHAAFNGFYKTLKLEMPSLECRHIDLAPDEAFSYEELLATDQEGQIAYRKGVRYVPRLLHVDKAIRSGNKLLPPMSMVFQLETVSKGPLDNLYLRKQDIIKEPTPHEISIEVKSVGLNFRDVLNAMGLYPGDPGPLGCECAGIVTAVGKDVSGVQVGDAVVGFDFGCLASQITVPADLFIRKPSILPFEDAAAIPIVFSTAYQALVILAHIKKGDKVLIHAAAGGVGLAAIQIAQMMGAEIYATAGSREKHDYLKSLGVACIYQSRTLDFAEEILKDTNGYGVDVVLNSLSGEGFIDKTVSACHLGARFVEIGKRNIWPPEKMKESRPDVQYYILAIDEMVKMQPQEVRTILKTVVSLFSEEKLKPLPSSCFGISDAIDAFEYLQKAKNIGKVVLTFPKSQLLKIDPAGSYLITGGLGGLGRKVAEWLAQQGAKHLVLAGRNVSQQIQIPDTTVETVALDVSQRQAVESLMQKFGNEWPPLKGIIHAAGLIDDGAIASQDWSRFEKVFAPKVQGKAGTCMKRRNYNPWIFLSSFLQSHDLSAILGKLIMLQLTLIWMLWLSIAKTKACLVYQSDGALGRKQEWLRILQTMVGRDGVCSNLKKGLKLCKWRFPRLILM